MSILILLFIDYDLFVAFALFFIVYLFFVKQNIEVTRVHKLLTYICVFLFFFIIRLLPIFDKNYLHLWNRIAQQNYLIGDGYFLSENIFLDLQLTLFSLSCNTNYSTYKIKYSSDYLDSSILTCPYDTPYGYVLNFIQINGNIWNLTVVIATILLFSIYIIYIDTVKNFNGKKFLLCTLLFLSPPINFLLFRLNIDIFIFLIVFIFAFKLRENFIIKTAAVFIATLIKFYTISIIFFDLVFKFIEKSYRHFVALTILLIVSIMYVIFFESNSEFLIWFYKPIESNINFGIFNDALYISQIFGISWIISYIILLFLVFGFVIIIPKEKVYLDLNSNELAVLALFLSTALFTNFDYRLVFLLLLIKPFLLNKINLSLISMTIFMYTSPSLLHAYESYYKIIRNDEIFFLDYSFYFFVAICLKTLWLRVFNPEFNGAN